MYKNIHVNKLVAVISLCAVLIGVLSISSLTARADDSLLFGQKQSYTAIVRADQKVVTYAKIVLNNQDDSDLKQTSFSVPEGVTVSNLSVYQIIPPSPSCLEYEQPAKDTGNRKCLKYDTEEYDFDQDYYYYGYSYYPYNQERKLSYKKIDVERSGEKYSFTLPEAVKPQKRGAYLVAYLAEGFVKGSFGLYNLEFKTLQVSQPIEEVKVAVDVASDLYTKEKRSKIDYANVTSDSALSSGASNKAIESKSLDQLQNQIGSGGTFTKTGKSLAPNEVLVVNGEFADEAWKLNLGWIIGGILGAILLIGAVVLLLKKANQQEEVVVTRKADKNGKK